MGPFRGWGQQYCSSKADAYNFQAKAMPAVPSRFDRGVCGQLPEGLTAKLQLCKELLTENLSLAETVSSRASREVNAILL